ALYDSLRRGPSADPEDDKGLAFAEYWSGHSGLAVEPLERYLTKRPDDIEARDLEDRLARERSAGFTAGFGRADDSDELRVETRSLDIRLPLAHEAALLPSWRRLWLKDPGGSLSPTIYDLGYERVWGKHDLWIAHLTGGLYARDSH